MLVAVQARVLTDMDDEEDGRTLEQKVASGETAATPFLALSTVAVLVAAVVAVALVIVALAYALA